jgi:hypothetical protein
MKNFFNLILAYIMGLALLPAIPIVIAVIIFDSFYFRKKKA